MRFFLLAILLSSIASAQDSLRVLVWNVWRGGNQVDQGPEKILRVIQDSDPDVVLMQESYDIDGERPTTGRWAAKELGWHAHQGSSPHLCVLSKRPLDAEYFHHDWHGVGARITDEQGRGFVCWSIWLDYRAYIPYALRDDPSLSDEALVAMEHDGSNRLPQARALMAAVEEQAKKDAEWPVLVGGDFNTPSHLDWTLDTTRIYRYRRDLPLPISQEMQAARFVDAFRQVHPCPVQSPGLTWTPMFRGRGEEKPMVFDRIDRLYVRKPLAKDAEWVLVPVKATTLPEVLEDDTIPVRERTFPSDHGAVLIDLEWRKVDR